MIQEEKIDNIIDYLNKIKNLTGGDIIMINEKYYQFIYCNIIDEFIELELTYLYFNEDGKIEKEYDKIFPIDFEELQKRSITFVSKEDLKSSINKLNLILNFIEND